MQDWHELQPSGSRDDSVSVQEAGNELERVLSDPEFRCAERNKKFLRYVAEEQFAGRENSLKAYAIAVDVFGRPPSFDASTDPIVRIEATRLRAALIRYYEAENHGKGIRIRLAKGHYAPEFVRDSEIRPVETKRRSAKVLEKLPRVLGAAITRKALAFGLLAALVSLACLGFVFRSAGVAITERPSISLELVLQGGPQDARAIEIRDSLMIALSGFNTLRLSAHDSYTASTSRTRGDTGASRSRYKVLLKHKSDAVQNALSWQVVDQQSGETLRAGQEWLATNNSQPAEIDHKLASTLAVRLASFRGVINTIETARELEAPSLGNGCVLRSRLALSSADKELMQQARSCLERTLRLRPYDPDAHATLAELLIAFDPVEAPTILTKSAGEHADEAIAMAPESDRSYYAKMQASFRTGQIGAAKLAGERAVELNPYNAFVAARYASMLFSIGDWKEAVPLALTASQLDEIPQPDAERTLAFDAYRRGEFGEAVLRLQRLQDSRCYLAQLLLAAALAQEGQEREAASAIAEIRQTRPDFERTFHADMAKRHITPELIAALGEGLQHAGSNIEIETTGFPQTRRSESATVEGL